MRVSIPARSISRVLAPSPLAPLPRWGEGNRCRLSFSIDIEFRHCILRSSVIQHKMIDAARALRETAVLLNRLAEVRVRSNRLATERDRT